MKNARLIFKRSFGKAFSFVPKSNSRKIILLYHSVGDSPWSMPPEAFKEQMEWLKSNVHLTNLQFHLMMDIKVWFQMFCQ